MNGDVTFASSPQLKAQKRMAYYVRLLSTSDQVIPVRDLVTSLEGSTLTVESGTDDAWGQLLLAHTNGREIAAIERNTVGHESMAAEELQEFLEESHELKPTSGAEWLRGFLPKVKTIYAFQILSGAEVNDGWSAITAVKTKLWNDLGGIFQADGEGFSNEEGYHVVWQFSENVRGTWWMGLHKEGRWVHFEMELGDRAQREAFLRGEVPAGANLAT